ncbi:MAG: 1-acyl-sn-glycerol-3-phosphate acyltransferase [Flavobacterium sp.]|nr:1-acyl-sn-glycerol-3-phosphate acyltransferase [Flavobacterium sp.]
MYQLFKIGAQLASKIYCKKTVANFDANTTFSNPKIIASNHPNSFFDAIQIAIHYPKPIYFLARGDAFKNPIVAKFLNLVHLIPIYRLSEGKNNLSKNDSTFKKCIELLQKKQTILIFSEGLCVQEWKLRPLKKGTARLALMALNEGISNLKIQPTALNYSSFKHNPKEVQLNFNNEFEPKIILNDKDLEFYKNFNLKLENGILKNMKVQADFNNNTHTSHLQKIRIKKLIFAIPAFIGFFANYWIYLLFKNFTQKKTKNTVFYDSVLFGLLLIFYPIIVFFISIFFGLILNFKIALIIFIFFPISAWFYKEYKS